MPNDSDQAVLELLKCCCRMQLNAAQREELLAHVATEPDWTHVVETAIDHRIEGFLSRHLQTLGQQHALGDQQERLLRRSKRTALRNLRLTRELIQLLKQLESEGIAAAPYKGPLLMHQVYGEIGLRATHDLDVLIDEKDLAAVRKIMLANGFEYTHPKTGIGALVQRRQVRDIGFIDRKRDLIVEVHWRFTNSNFYFPLDGRTLLKQLQPAVWAGCQFKMIPPEEMLLLLCVHGAMHCWHRLEMVLMLAEFCRVHQQLDWDLAERLARENWQLRAWRLGLLLAVDSLGAPAPESVLERARGDSSAVGLARQVNALWTRDRQEPGLIPTMMFHLTLLPRRRSRVRYLAGHVFSAVFRPLLDAKNSGAPRENRARSLVNKHSLRPGVIWRLFRKMLHRH